MQADELQKIRALGDTEAGGLLVLYIQNVVARSMNDLVNVVDADNVAEVSYAQAVSRFGGQIVSLLTADIADTLQQHNVQEVD